MSRFTSILLFLFFFSCANKETKTLKFGDYRLVMTVMDGENLPVVMRVLDENNLEIYNAEETIQVDEIEYKNDSVYISMPVFESVLIGKLDDDYNLRGYYIKPNLNRSVEFYTIQGSDRFPVSQESVSNITGNWETVFSPNSEEDRYVAKGIFNQEVYH